MLESTLSPKGNVTPPSCAMSGIDTIQVAQRMQDKEELNQMHLIRRNASLISFCPQQGEARTTTLTNDIRNVGVPEDQRIIDVNSWLQQLLAIAHVFTSTALHLEFANQQACIPL